MLFLCSCNNVKDIIHLDIEDVLEQNIIIHHINVVTKRHQQRIFFEEIFHMDIKTI